MQNTKITCNPTYKYSVQIIQIAIAGLESPRYDWSGWSDVVWWELCTLHRTLLGGCGGMLPQKILNF